jgi:hypothetical protein
MPYSIFAAVPEHQLSLPLVPSAQLGMCWA